MSQLGRVTSGFTMRRPFFFARVIVVDCLLRLAPSPLVAKSCARASRRASLRAQVEGRTVLSRITAATLALACAVTLGGCGDDDDDDNGVGPSTQNASVRFINASTGL